MLQPKLFRREPTEILAIQWNGENVSAVQDFVGVVEAEGVSRGTKGFQVAGIKGTASLWIAANQDWLPIEVGEWIACDEHGCYPIKDNGGKPFNYVEANAFQAGDTFYAQGG